MRLKRAAVAAVCPAPAPAPAPHHHRHHHSQMPPRVRFRPPSLRRAYSTLPPSAGAVQLSTTRRLISIHGPDAAHFLQGLTTINIPPLTTTGAYSAFLTPHVRSPPPQPDPRSHTAHRAASSSTSSSTPPTAPPRGAPPSHPPTTPPTTRASSSNATPPQPPVCSNTSRATSCALNSPRAKHPHGPHGPSGALPPRHNTASPQPTSARRGSARACSSRTRSSRPSLSRDARKQPTMCAASCTACRKASGK